MVRSALIGFSESHQELEAECCAHHQGQFISMINLINITRLSHVPGLRGTELPRCFLDAADGSFGSMLDTLTSSACGI